MKLPISSLLCALVLLVGVESSSRPCNMVTRLRGGGLVDPKTAARIYGGFYALNGVLGMPAPETATANIGGSVPVVKEGTTDYVVYENLGAVSLGYGILATLAATRTSMSATKMVAYAGIPCFYTTYKNWLKGLTDKLGGVQYQGLALTAFMSGCLYCLFTGKSDTKLIAQAFSVAPLIIGIVSEISPETGMKIAGMGTPTSKSGKAFFMWFAPLMVGWGALALMLLDGRDGIESIGYASVLEILFMIDCIWLRSWNVGVAPDASNYVFLGVPLLTAAATLL